MKNSITLTNGFSLKGFTVGNSIAIGAKTATGINVNALVYTRYNQDGKLEIVLNEDILNAIGGTFVAENFDKSLPKTISKDELIKVLADKLLCSEFGRCYMCTNSMKNVTLDGKNNRCDGMCDTPEVTVNNFLKKIQQELESKMVTN